jgi:hypothetical protein
MYVIPARPDVMADSAWKEEALQEDEHAEAH